MLKKIILAACTSWASATLLGLLFATCTEECFSVDILSRPGVLLVAVLISTVIAALMTPLVFWSCKSGDKNLIYSGAGLLILLSAYVIVVTPTGGRLGLYGLLALAISGLVSIGLFHR
jgi:hypothetical protein